MCFHATDDVDNSINLYKALDEMDPLSGLSKIGVGCSLLAGHDYIQARDLLKKGKETDQFK